MTALPRQTGTIWCIQYLRGAAAVAVVVFHQLQGVHGIFRLGEHGVDLFFVISGFIMFVLTDSRNVTPASFALDRIARIVPPYWLATVLTFLAAFVGAEIYHGSSDLGLLAKSLLFIPTLNEFGLVQPALYLGWTLNFEMFFYAIFAGVLLLSRGRVAVLALVLISLVAVGTALQPEGPIGMTYTSPLLLEFLGGVVLGALFGIELDRFAVIIQAGAVLLIASALGVFSILYCTLAFGAVSVVVLACGLLVERAGRMPQNRALKMLGDASFAIYLFQQFAFEAVRAAGHAVGGFPRGVLPAASIVAAIGLGLVVLRYVERPLTRWTKSLFRYWSGEPVKLALS